jgi:hypothetical protein
MYVMHCLTLKLCAMFCWSSAARGELPVVSLTIVKLMIDVAVKMIRPVVPRAGSDENTAAAELLGPVIAIRSAIVRRKQGPLQC